MPTTNQPVAELVFSPDDATPFSTDEATLKDWAQARDQLAEAPKCWLATGRASGSPHVMPVLAVWSDDAIYVTMRPASLKSRNLSRDPRCVITVSTDAVDLVVEGSAHRVSDDAALRRVVDAFDAKYGWRLTLRDGRLHEDGLPGQPEYVFFEVTPAKAFGYGPDGLTATRWRF